jgi:hypothetical protein
VWVVSISCVGIVTEIIKGEFGRAWYGNVKGARISSGSFFEGFKMEFLVKTQCGKKTCASKQGKFCIFVRTYMGCKWSCGLFNGVKLYDNEDGWLARCPECLKKYGTGDEK